MEHTFSLTNMTKWIMPHPRAIRPDEHAVISAGQIATMEAALVPVVDWQTVAQVVCQQAPSLIAQGRIQTLEGRLRRLPRKVLEASPWLLYWSGVCCLPLNPEQGRADFEQAYILFRGQNVRGQNVSGMLHAWAGVVDSILLGRTDFTPLARWVEALGDILRDHPSFPSLDVEACVTQAMLGALTQHLPQHPDMLLWEQRAKQLLQCGLEVDQQFTLGNRLFLHYLHKGDTAAAAWVLHTLKAHASLPCAVVQVEWRISQALYSLLRISADACLEAITDGLEIARNTGAHSGDFQLYALGVQAALVKGNHEAAKGFLGNMGTLLIANRHLDASLYHYLLAWDGVIRNDLQRATEHARLALALAEEADAPHSQALCHALLAQALFEYGGHHEALRHLARTRAYRDITRSKYVEYLALILEAQFRFMRSSDMQGRNSAAGGRTPGAADVRGAIALSKAFALARKHGYTNMPAMRSCAMAILCKKALENGIEVEYVRSHIKKHSLQPPCPSVECESWPWPIKIYTLGRFSIVKSGEVLDFSSKDLGKNHGKIQGKPLLLLKALIALGGRDVSDTQLIDALWPDAEGDAGHQVLRITLHRLRQLLGHEKVIIMRDNSLTLDTSCCWVDVWALERFFSQTHTTQAQSLTEKAITEKALNIYQGHFLGNDMEHPWALALRERLRSKFLRYLEQTGKHYENTDQWDKAINSYRKGLEIDPLAEVLYQRLMVCYQQQGRRAEALSVYQRCCTVFSSILGVAPSHHVEATHRALEGSK